MNLSYICCVSYKCVTPHYTQWGLQPSTARHQEYFTFFNTPTAETLPCLHWHSWMLVVPFSQVVLEPHPHWAGAPPPTQSLSLFWDRVFKLHRLALNFVTQSDIDPPSLLPQSAKVLGSQAFTTGSVLLSRDLVWRKTNIDNFYQEVQKVSKGLVKELTWSDPVLLSPCEVELVTGDWRGSADWLLWLNCTRSE